MNSDMIATTSQNVQLAAPMWKAATWLSMMSASFKVADLERNDLARNGPWTARTNNIQRYARGGIDLYA